MKIGDVLYVAYDQGHRGIDGEIVVTKIGKRWAEYIYQDTKSDRGPYGRFDIHTMSLEADRGYGSSGIVFPSKEAWAKIVEISSRWESFRRRIERSYAVPDGVTSEDITSAMEILHMELYP